MQMDACLSAAPFVHVMAKESQNQLSDLYLEESVMLRPFLRQSHVYYSSSYISTQAFGINIYNNWPISETLFFFFKNHCLLICQPLPGPCMSALEL